MTDHGGKALFSAGALAAALSALYALGVFELHGDAIGERTILASVRVAPPAVDSWHTIKFVAKGERFQASLDGRLVLEHSDERFAVGSVGLWTKADSVTEFDDFEVLGSKVKGETR